MEKKIAAAVAVRRALRRQEHEGRAGAEQAQADRAARRQQRVVLPRKPRTHPLPVPGAAARGPHAGAARATRSFGYDAGATSSATRASRSSAARRSRSSARTAPARRRCCACSPGSCTPRAGEREVPPHTKLGVLRAARGRDARRQAHRARSRSRRWRRSTGEPAAARAARQLPVQRRRRVQALPRALGRRASARRARAHPARAGEPAAARRADAPPRSRRQGGARERARAVPGRGRRGDARPLAHGARWRRASSR